MTVSSVRRIAPHDSYTPMHASRLTVLALSLLLAAGCTNPGVETRPESVISPREAIVGAAERPDQGVTGLFAFEIKGTGRQDNHVYLNSEADYRDQRCLTIAIRPAAVTELTDRLGGDPVALLKGKTLRVRGTAKRVTIRFYSNGVPTSSYYYQTQVFVDDLSHLEIEDLGQSGK
jgi:hypothetical protein